MAKRGQSAAYLLALRKKHGLGEFKARRKKRLGSSQRRTKKNASKVPFRSKSKSRTRRKTVKTVKSFKMGIGW